MDRNEFVSTLRAVLSGEVPASVVEDNVRYYDSYISQEIAGGKSEQEVLDSLGDPRLIAKTIIDTSGQQGSREAYEGTYTQEETGGGFRREFRQEESDRRQYRQFDLNTGFGRFLVLIVVFVVLLLVFTIVGGILSWLLPVLLPILLVVWIVRIFSGRR